MTDTELTITVRDDLTVVARRDDGAESPPGRLQMDDLHKDLIRIFEIWLTEPDRTWNRRELEVFGSLLYRSLFPAPVDELLRQSLIHADDDGRLRVQLSFTERAGELARIPWEYLFYPSTGGRAGFFFATNPRVVLSRYIPLEAGRTTLRPDEDALRILVVVSKPIDLGPVHSDEVAAAISALSGEFPLVLSSLAQPTPEKLMAALSDSKPHVLHFMGHGRYNEAEGQGEIALVGPGGAVLWYSDAMLAELVDHVRAVPRLIVLHACEGATTDVRDRFAGMAPQLIRMGVQAVVAMQYLVSNRAAIRFSTAFYQQLGAGKPIDHAIQEGRYSLTQTPPPAGQTRLLGIPVLYMHSRDGIIQPASVADAYPRIGTAE